jgi:hypothetical protein
MATHLQLQLPQITTRLIYYISQPLKFTKIMTLYNVHAMQHFWEKVKTEVLTEAQEPLTGITFWHCSELYH